MVFVWYMVFNATFNNISFISWRSVLLVCWNRKTRRKQPTCHKSLTNLITLCCIEYTSPWMGFELKTLVVIGSDRTGSWKSNYDTITTTFNATFIIASAISWRSVLLVVLRGENQQPSASKWQTLYHKVLSSTSRHDRDLNPPL